MKMGYDQWLEMQYDSWMEIEPEIEEQAIEYFLQEFNDEEIYIIGDEPAEYEVWEKGKKWDDGLTRVQAWTAANELYFAYHDEDRDDPYIDN